MINENTARKYCRDDISKIENYDKAVNDPTQTWIIHHRLELTLDGKFALTRAQLIMHDMYFNRRYYELIFLTQSEHTRIHNCGRTHTEETRRRISESHTGKHLSLETRRKISEARKGMKATDETRMKMSLAQHGKNNAMYGRHHSEESRRKMSESAKRRCAKKKSNDSVRSVYES